MWGLIVTESEIYQLGDFATIEPQNLPLESYVKYRREPQRYEESGVCLNTSNFGGTAEAKLFRP